MKIILGLVISFLSLAFIEIENPLANTKWHVISFYDRSNKSLISNTGQFPEECELKFEREKVNVNTCNAYKMSYRVKGNKINFSDGPPGLQASYCGNGFSNLVEEFIAFKIQSPATFIIRSDSLFIKAADSSIISCKKIK